MYIRPMESPNPIAKRRLDMGLTQEALGGLLGTSAMSVSRWENGAMPGRRMLGRIREHMGLSPAEVAAGVRLPEAAE